MNKDSFLSSKPVTKMIGITADSASRLAKIGISTLGMLAGADPDKISVALGVDTKKSEAVIASAKKALGK